MYVDIYYIEYIKYLKSMIYKAFEVAPPTSSQFGHFGDLVFELPHSGCP